MKRLLWLGVGLAVGALVVRKLTQVAHSYSPGGLAASARESGIGLLDSVRDFVTDVRDGMAEHEQALREAFEQGVPIEDVTDEYGAAR